MRWDQFEKLGYFLEKLLWDEFGKIASPEKRYVSVFDTRKTLLQDYFTITSPCRPKTLKNKSVPNKSWSLFLVCMLLYFV